MGIGKTRMLALGPSLLYTPDPASLPVRNQQPGASCSSPRAGISCWGAFFCNLQAAWQPGFQPKLRLKVGKTLWNL